MQNVSPDRATMRKVATAGPVGGVVMTATQIFYGATGGVWETIGWFCVWAFASALVFSFFSWLVENSDLG